jgi:hypothetical protein
VAVAVVVVVVGCGKVNLANKNNEKEGSNSVDLADNINEKNNNDDGSNNIEETLTVEDYYPFIENRRMYYEGIGNEYASQEVYVDFIENNKIQLRSSNGGTVVAKVLEISNGELKVVNSKEEFYYRQNIMEEVSEENKEEIMLKEPLVVGTAWETSNGNKKSITAVDEKISTPYGNLIAIEVTEEGEDFESKEYYSKDIGFVKSVFIGNDFEVSTSLATIEEKPEIQTIKFYYPISEETEFVLKYKTIPVSFETNENIEDKILENYKEFVPDDGVALMSKNTEINKLYLDIDKNMVYIDLTHKFIEEMNVGAESESLILQALTNTLGNYYNVDKIMLTIDGENYVSGHIELDKGEVLYVDYYDVNEISY